MGVVRQFLTTDLDDILDIESNAFPKTPYPRDLFMKWYRAMPELFLVYEEDSEILGYIMFFPDGHVASVAVKKGHRRKGIGTVLMSRALNKCQGMCWVEVRQGNEGAQLFYESLGLTVVDIEEGYYGDEDAVIMAKEQLLDT